MSQRKLMSRAFGGLANTAFPSVLQERLNKAYIKHFDIDMSEFDDLKNYKSLNALFTRRLLRSRELEEGFISPCDGLIMASGSSFGQALFSLAFSIKDNTYNIKELLKGAFKEEELLKGLDYLNIYLSPRDYHRYHSPYDMQILKASYISGDLYSVNQKALEKYSNLYAKNERVVLKCKINDFLIWLVFVGATNVGKMRFNFDESIQTNSKKAYDFVKDYENIKLLKGEEIGNFEMGSTIVIIAQKGKINFLDKKNVKFSMQIGELN